jgi:DNA-binding SARP family transcriptional activator
MTHSTVRIRLFGPISVYCGGRHLGPADFGGAKPKHLLEILLLARGAPVSKYRLIDALWGDRPPSGAVGALETHVSLVRSRLGLPRPGLIIGDSETYSAAIPPGALDVDQFDDALRLALRARGGDWRVHLDRALELGRHDLLEDEPYAEWVIPIRDRYARLVHDASLMVAERALAEGRPDEAVIYSDMALARDHLSERALRARMRGAYCVGRQHEAILVYNRSRRLLRAEIHVPPMEETTDLYEAIRRHDRAAVMVSSELSTPLTVPPVGQEISGTRLANDWSWLGTGRRRSI